MYIRLGRTIVYSIVLWCIVEKVYDGDSGATLNEAHRDGSKVSKASNKTLSPVLLFRPPSSRPVSSGVPIALHIWPFVGKIYIIYAQTKTDTNSLLSLLILILLLLFYIVLQCIYITAKL